MQASTAQLLDEGELARATRLERIKVFNERSIFGALSAFAGIALGCGVIWAGSGLPFALLWTVPLVAIELAILLTGYRCRHRIATGGDPGPCNRFQLGLTALTGVAWGALPWFTGAGNDFYLYLASFAMLVGVSGVGMVAMSSYAFSTYMFFIGIYLVPIFQVLLNPGELSAFLVAGLFVSMVVQIAYSRELRRIVVRDLEQSVRNTALIERLENIVIHDQLTGAYSRSYVFEQMAQKVALRQRHGNSACVIMFDLDHFKQVNDSYGHPAGDRVLVQTVIEAGALLREGDVLGRVGGEEFMALLPNTGLPAARHIAERLRVALAEATVQEGDDQIHMPASFGVAELKSAESYSEWFRRADHALYRAKALGRDRVVVAD